MLDSILHPVTTAVLFASPLTCHWSRHHVVENIDGKKLQAYLKF